MTDHVAPLDAADLTGDSEPVSGMPLSLLRFVRDLADSDLSRQALIDRLSRTAAELLRAEGSAVFELAPDLRSGRIAGACGLAAEHAERILAVRTDRSLVREATTGRRAVAVNDPNDPRIHPDIRSAVQVRNVAVAPIMLDDVAVGLIGCMNTRDDGFGEQHLTMLEHLAAHGAIVMRGQQLVAKAQSAVIEARHRAEEAARAARANAILAASARDFANVSDRDRLLACLATVLRDEMGAVGFVLYEANPRLQTARYVHEWGVRNADSARIVETFWRTVLGDVVRGATPVFAERLDVSPAHARLTESLRDAGVNAAALLPLVIGERVQGLLSVRFAGTHAFEEDERMLLTNLAAQFALAWRNTQYVDEVELRAHRLTLLARAQQQLTQLASEESLPGGIAEATHMVIPGRVCEVLVLNTTGAPRGESEPELRRVVRLEHGSPVSVDLAPLADLSLARLTASTGVSRLACHLETGTDISPRTGELCAAVRFGQRTAGVIRVLSAPEHPLDAQDLDLLTIIARHAGTAVETARLFTLQDLQRQRAEGAGELARAALHAAQLEEGAAELLATLDRYVPSIGKAIGVARGRDGMVEYVAVSGTLDLLRGHRPGSTRGVTGVAPDGKPVVFASLRDAAPDDLRESVPDDWAFVIPLTARERVLGVLLVTAPRQSPLQSRDRVTLERLSSSLALALDALLLDEEERLAREREHLLATALTTINHPIFILDRLGVRYANPAAAREYGWSQQQLMEMQFEALVVGNEAREGFDTQTGVVESGVHLSHDVHRRMDGSEFPAAVTVSPLLGHDGDVLGQVVSVRNVSQDRRLEEQLRHTEKMVALGELVAGVAHEINNPLTGISAFAQILLEEELVGEQRESVQLIKQEADRAKGVIADLLLFARKTGRGSGPVDLNAMIEQTVRLRSYPLRVAKVQVELDLDPSRPEVSGDAQKLQQVLLNVISNAEHAMQDRPVRTLTVRTTRDGDRVTIAATDTGSGMSAETKQRIFEPFYTTRAPGAGTGLGLSVAYGIIDAHGGTITVETEPEVGTTVRIELPALPAPSA